MEEIQLVVRLGLALILGGAIGLEREVNEKKSATANQDPTAIIGLRTFALISLLGAISGHLYTHNNYVFSILISASFMVMLMAYYTFDSMNTKDFGFTTELAAIFTFMIGAFLTLNIIPIQIILALGVLLILLLSRKNQIKRAVQDVKRREINAFISFAVIALVILPFLPNETYSLSDLPFLHPLLEAFNVDSSAIATVEFVNAFKLWLIVALITGIDLAGYILERTIGATRGWVLASLAGGFVSSTATTQGLAQESKENTKINTLVAAALFANLASFFQVGILIAGVNSVFFVQSLAVLIPIIITGFLTSLFFLWQRHSNGKDSIQKAKKQSHEIFNLAPALKFAGLYLVINIVSKLGLVIFGQAGFLVTSAIGALVGIDVVMINTSSLANTAISTETALWAFVLVNTVNLIGKSIYSFIQGNREFALKFSLSVGIIILSSVLGVLFF